MLALLLLSISLFVNLCVALVVFLKNTRSVVHRMLTLLIVSASAWVMANYLADQPSDNALLWARITFVGPIFAAMFGYLFVQYLGGVKKLTTNNWIIVVGSLIATVVSVFGDVVTWAAPRYVNGMITGYNVDRGYGYIVMLGWLLIVAICVARSLLIAYRKARGVYRMQVHIIFWGVILFIIFMNFTNVILPLILGNSVSAQYAPLATIALSVSFSYAILRHQFLSIRAVVARSVAYILLVSTIMIVYAVVLFGVINVIFSSPDQEFLRQIASLVAVAPLAITFQSIKRFFDRITSKLFYRDSYDIQEVLDDIGNVVVSEINLERIVDNTRTILTSALKPTFVKIILFRGDDHRIEEYGEERAGSSLTELVGRMKDQSKELVVVDDLSYDNRLRKAFLSSGVALSLRLKTQDQIVGYVVFGDKLSGDVYSTQDKDLLSIVANELAVTIQNALRFDEIEHFNATLQRKVVEATSKLRHSNIKLRALDEAKDEFVGLASHQLRTPLTSVKGYISMLLEGDAGEITPIQRKLLQEAYTSSERMVHLIGDFLNVSRLQTGKFMLEVRPTDLAKLVNEEVTSLESTAKAHGLRLRYRAPSHFPILYLDEGKIRQVVMNFIDNAIYYSDEETVIDVSLSIEDGDAVMRVKDTGIGVPVAEQAHLFTKFYRASNARKQRPDGTGVGIFLAKKVAIAHGGSVVFASTEGKGSTFGLRLPVAPLSQPPTDESIAV